MITRTKRSLAVIALALLPLAACSSKAPAPRPTHAPTATGTAPTTTQRVYLATAVACENLGTASFVPLKVSGPGYTTTVKAVQGCTELQIWNSYVYDVPMPNSGTVTITPGNQPAAQLDAAQVTAGRAATVYYAHDNGDHYKVTTIEYDKADDVKGAA